jgi:predicted nucleic acid-binding protein
MLLDTSGLLCLLHRDQPQHPLAREIYSGAVRRLTHNYVLDELVAVAQSRRVPRNSALSFSRQLLNDATIELVWVDEALH